MIYTRFSSRFQHSTEDQRRACQKWADENGIEVIEVLSDEATSGRRSRRPGLARLMKMLDRDEADVVITFATNRLHRKMHAAVQFVQEVIIEKSKRCVFVAQNIDTKVTQTWKIVFQLFSMLDELQVTMMAGNIRESHVGLLLQQLVHGTISFGYCGVTVPGGRAARQNKPRQRLEIDPVNSDWVKRIFQWYVEEKLDYHDITRRLIQLRAPLPPKGATWTPNAVRRVIRNMRYIGVWSYGWYESIWQSKADYAKQVRREVAYHPHQIDGLRIIDDELFARAQEISASRANRGGRKKRDHDGETVINPFKGLLVCPTHNVPLRAYGASGVLWTCHKCRQPGEEQALYSVPSRDLTRRKICGVILEKMRARPGLADEIVLAAQREIEEFQQPDTIDAEALKAELKDVKHQLAAALQRCVG